MQTVVSPIELCLESLDSVPDDQPYVRCVAISGAEPGLGISADGVITWCENALASALLWVSADNQLILVRKREDSAVRLIRAERFLDLPLEKPVVVLDEDIVAIGAYSFRIHVHGVAQTVEAPVRLALRRMNSMVVGAAIAAVSMAGCHTSASTGAPGSSDASTTSSVPFTTSSGGASSETRTASTGGTSALDEPALQGGARAVTTSLATKAPTTKPVRPIEIRHHPPKPAPPIEVREKPPSVRWDEKAE